MRPPDRSPSLRARQGFSLVEMLVAMLFVSLLMAGTAAVFKASLGNYVAASENVASGRQNRMALEVLLTDLNTAGMTPSSLTSVPLGLTTANPAFGVVPNVTYTLNGTNYAADQLFMYYDVFLPYTTTVKTAMPNTAQDVTNGTALGADASFALTFADTTQSGLASKTFTNVSGGQGMLALLQTTGKSLKIKTLDASGNLTLINDTNLNTATSRSGAPVGSVVNLIVPNNYVRYSIQPVLLDPAQPTVTTPCLVRDLIAYPTDATTAATFATTLSTTIVADNVTAFHVGFSADGGQTWAGMNANTPQAWPTTTTAWSDLTGPESSAATPTLNYQLTKLYGSTATVGQLGAFWFRFYAVMVRVDMTTRTLNKRTEFAAAGSANVAQYKYQTRTIIITPRHSGLAY